MIRRMPRGGGGGRSGITLTEILISILILGIGVTSLATLFPIGLVRLQKAQRLTRGAFLIESAIADLGARNLLAKNSFLGTPIVAAWFFTAPSGTYDPFVQDTPAFGFDWAGPPSGVSRSVGPGLPVCYDPLWRAVATWSGGVGLYPPPTSAGPEARFGQGVGFGGGGAGFLRDDPNPGGGPTTASAHGLQRITNLPPALTAAVLHTFVSPEDLVLQDAKGVYPDPNGATPQLLGPSPLVPDMAGTLVQAGTAIEPTIDWRYSFFVTGSADPADPTAFDGDIVVCENRQFGLDPMPSPLTGAGTCYQATGETVVEAVWGYSASPDPKTLAGGVGYGTPSAKRTVLLRWPSTMADPDVRVGGWIADVTYERSQAVINAGRFPYIYPGQRCKWYQISKRTVPTFDPGFPGDKGVAYRQMTVWVSTPLQAMTPLQFPGGTPYHVEAALIMPSVVHVYTTPLFTR
jgi:type II secretory pathway pseudopilin PulG